MNAGSTILEKPLWAAIAFMLLVRAMLIARYGVTFEISDRLWQLLDADVLRTDPVRSLYFLHAQPPLFNTLYMVSLQLPASVGPVFLQAIYILSSISMMVVVHFFLRRFGYGAVAAAIGAAGFSALPQVLLYENTFQYAHLEATLVLGATVRRQINCYGSGLSGREAPAHLLIDVKRRLHGGSSVCVGWSVV